MSPFEYTRNEVFARRGIKITKTDFRAAVRKVRAIEAEDGHYPLASTNTASKLAINWNLL